MTKQATKNQAKTTLTDKMMSASYQNFNKALFYLLLDNAKDKTQGQTCMLTLDLDNCQDIDNFEKVINFKKYQQYKFKDLIISLDLQNSRICCSYVVNWQNKEIKDMCTNFKIEPPVEQMDSEIENFLEYFGISFD